MSDKLPAVTKVILADADFVVFSVDQNSEALVHRISLIWDRASGERVVGFGVTKHGVEHSVKIPVKDLNADQRDNQKLIDLFGAKALNEAPLIPPTIISAIADHMNWLNAPALGMGQT